MWKDNDDNANDQIFNSKAHFSIWLRWAKISNSSFNLLICEKEIIENKFHIFFIVHIHKQLSQNR